MANLILDINTQFSKGLVVSFRVEYGIVAKALPTTFLSDYVTIHDAFEGSYLSVYY